MDETTLRTYWKAYAEAWRFLKNWQQVTDSHIANATRTHEIGMMNRLFCLVVKKEIKKLGAGNDATDYKEQLDRAWHLFRQYCGLFDSEQYWEDVVKDIGIELRKNEYSDFSVNLYVHVVLAELERLWKNK